MGKKNDNTLVKNASFLMIAALISKIIGMLYKSPLSNTLGNSSMGLFNYAQNVYFILLMIASFSIPQAVSKIMAEKLAFKRYRDAQKVFHCALLYVAAMGGVVALFCFFGSSILVPESMSGARLALKCWRRPFSCLEFWVPSAGIFRRIVICCRLPCLRLWSSAL